jgi:zinc protease
MQLVGEMLREPAFSEKELDEIRQQRINAIETQKQEPQMLAMNAISRALAPYPKGDVRYVSTPDESIADLKAVTLDNIKQFYKEFYGAAHSELAVVGDFDAETVQSQASKLAKGFTSNAHYAEVFPTYQHTPPQSIRLEAPDKANAMFLAATLINMSDEDPDYPAMVLGNYLMGGGFLNSRLATRIRQKDGLSYGVGSQFAASTKHPYGQFFTYAISAPQNSDKVEKAFREEVARALKDGFTSEEVESGKKGWLQAQQVGRAQDPELVRRLATERHYERTMTFDEALQNKVAALTPDQITQAMRRHLKPEDITVVKAGDFKKADAVKN